MRDSITPAGHAVVTMSCYVRKPLNDLHKDIPQTA